MFNKLKSLFGYSINDFASDIIKVYYKKGFAGNFEWNKKSTVLKFDDGRTLHLNNLYQEHKHLPKDEILDFIDRFLQSQDEEDIAWDEAKENIYPRIKTQSEVALRKLYIRSVDNTENVLESELWPLGSDLVFELVIDSDVNITTVTYDQLKDWGINSSDAKSRAFENFNKVSKEAFEEVSSGLYRSTWEDCYDASRIVLPELLAKKIVKGDVVAAIPTRDILIFTGSEDVAGLAAFADLLRDYYNSQRYISFRPYVFTNNHWDFYYPSIEHKLYSIYEQLHQNAIKGDYDEQKELLENIFEKEEHDVFVASYSIMQHEDSDESFSSGTWSEGVPTYLPKTDIVALLKDINDELEVIGFVKWDNLIEHCQSIMQKTDHEPPRFFVDTFPSDEMIAKLTFDSI